MKGYQIQEAFCSKLRLQIISNLVSKKLLFTELKKLTNASDVNNLGLIEPSVRHG